MAELVPYADGRSYTEMPPFSEWLGQQSLIEKGDCVYVVSDMLELAKVYKEQGKRLVLDELIDKLKELVGEEGTLLFPTFNWDFCKGIGFDYYKTPVRTGALPKAALKRADFERTAHPLYSFAVWGAHKQELLMNDCKDSFGPGTIFEKLYQWDARVLAIGVSALSGTTYIHHVEQVVGVPYRYNKEFTADYTDKEGVCEKRTYRMFVRDLDMDPRHINGFAPLEEQMRGGGLIRTGYYASVPCHLLRIADLDVAVRRDILENDSQNMYHYRKL